MAIYRGAGGAGDATADAASEASLIKTLAVEVQADADAAEAARAAAVVAKNAAELAETNAETAETNAETAEANAETAQAAAEAAQAAATTSSTNAANSATAAQTAETNAETAETNAAASASAASTSATNAASSASSASASASTATTQATNASNSASAAATSATNASTSATAAATSASNAATSATSASNSASTATTQATNAANSATAAATSATNSANSATASASSATDSAASATLANDWATKTSAPVAGGEYSAKYHAQQSATSATNASNSASSAATSATNASNSATASASSASDAAASAAAAAASYDNFDDRYLGSKSSAPTLDNDGNALLTGALYYNNGTVTPADKGMYVYDGSQWIAASAASTAILTIYKFTATGGQTTFSGTGDTGVSLVYTAGSVIITLNGVVLEIPSEVTASSGTSVVLSTGAVAGDELNIYAFATFNVANTYTQAQVDATFLTKSNPSYTGTLTGGTGVVNIGSGQFYKDASGNLGIGTSSPTQALDVNGNILGAASITIGTSGLYQAGSIYSDSNWGMIFRAKQASPGQADFMWANSAANERMRIDSSGNLLVGKTASDTTNAGIWAYNSAGQGRINFIKGTESGTGATSTCVFYYNGTSVGSITSSSTATAYNTSSDYRLKENIAPMTGALDTVSALKPVTYNWKADGSSGQGFIAHELQAVVPDCVTGEKDAIDKDGNPVYQGIDTSFLVATLTAAIQELKAEVDSLKSEVTALKGQA